MPILVLIQWVAAQTGDNAYDSQMGSAKSIIFSAWQKGRMGLGKRLKNGGIYEDFKLWVTEY